MIYLHFVVEKLSNAFGTSCIVCIYCHETLRNQLLIMLPYLFKLGQLPHRISSPNMSLLAAEPHSTPRPSLLP